MLDTLMALWNQNHKENRRKIGKILLTFLFLCISISLLLVTINNSFWLVFPKGNSSTRNKVVVPDQNTLEQLGGSETHVVSATPTKTATVVASLPCVRIPPTPVRPTAAIATATPHKKGIYPVNRRKWSQPRPKPTPVKTKKPIARVTPTAKISPRPTPKPTSAVIRTPVATVTTKVIPTVTPIHTATVSPVVTGIVGNVTATPSQDVQATVTVSFAPNVRLKGPAPLANANTIEGDSQMIRSLPVRCTNGAIEPATSTRTAITIARHIDWLLGGSLFGTMLLYAVVCAAKRKKAR